MRKKILRYQKLYVNITNTKLNTNNIKVANKGNRDKTKAQSAAIAFITTYTN